MGGEGVVSGSGGETAFCLGESCGDVSTAGYMTVVHIHALTWANEITWNIDGGTEFGPYEDNSDSYEEIELTGGDHVLYVMDAYGDGWHGGYWELLDCNDVSRLGGETEGQVEDAGGEVGF